MHYSRDPAALARVHAAVARGEPALGGDPAILRATMLRWLRLGAFAAPSSFDAVRPLLLEVDPQVRATAPDEARRLFADASLAAFTPYLREWAVRCDTDESWTALAENTVARALFAAFDRRIADSPRGLRAHVTVVRSAPPHVRSALAAVLLTAPGSGFAPSLPAMSDEGLAAWVLSNHPSLGVVGDEVREVLSWRRR